MWKLHATMLTGDGNVACYKFCQTKVVKVLEFVVVYLIQILALVTDGMYNRRNCLKYVSYNIRNAYKRLGYDFLNVGCSPQGLCHILNCTHTQL